MPKISVVVPVYNVEKFLERCLNSIVNQTFKDIEIICVNDGSTDNSRKILDKYTNYSNIKIIDQINAGLSEARNTGLLNAKGEYIAFIDSDDYIDQNFFEVLYNTAFEKNADIACAGIIRENNKKQIELVKYSETQCSNNTKDKFLLAGSPKYNFVWNKLYKKEILIKNNIKFISGMIYEDLCFTPDILEKSNLLVVCPNTFYHYWKHPGTLIKGDSDKARADKIVGNEYLKEKCRYYGINTNVKNQLLYKEDFLLLGIPFLRKIEYRATKKFYLFGFIPFLEIRKRV